MDTSTPRRKWRHTSMITVMDMPTKKKKGRNQNSHDHAHGHEHGDKDDIPAWKKKAMESGSQRPYGGTLETGT
jgi:hypothetical protein